MSRFLVCLALLFSSVSFVNAATPDASLSPKKLAGAMVAGYAVEYFKTCESDSNFEEVIAAAKKKAIPLILAFQKGRDFFTVEALDKGLKPICVSRGVLFTSPEHTSRLYSLMYVRDKGEQLRKVCPSLSPDDAKFREDMRKLEQLFGASYLKRVFQVSEDNEDYKLTQEPEATLDCDKELKAYESYTRGIGSDMEGALIVEELGVQVVTKLVDILGIPGPTR